MTNVIFYFRKKYCFCSSIPHGGDKNKQETGSGIPAKNCGVSGVRVVTPMCPARLGVYGPKIPHERPQFSGHETFIIHSYYNVQFNIAGINM